MAYATNSLGNYSGTIVVSPIRPSGPSSSIATVFSNEIKGAHHTYETLAEMNSMPLNRRDWGMLVTVYNDPTTANNKTYTLKYNFSSTSLSDNNNWIEFVTTGASFVATGGEWLNSVQTVATTPTVFTDGYRYLVQVGGTGIFAGQDGKVAQWSNVLSAFQYTIPTNGTTLRSDDQPNTIYKYQGNHPSGVWVKEFSNSIRYLTADSSNGLSYSATSSQTPLTSLSESVYYVKFNMTSSGTVSLNIDSLGHVAIKKLENNVLNFTTTGDIVPNLYYQLLYNGTFYQTVLPQASTTTIGVAPDATYADGLFDYLTPSTPIGTAIDLINQVLRTIVGSPGASPSSFPAPPLSSWSANGSFTNGKLSFDNTTVGFAGATGSPYGSVGRGETFSSSNYYRLGIMSKVLQPITGTQYYQDITGVLNISNTPATQYATFSFGNATVGTLSFHLNGSTISSVSLASSAAIDTTSGGATSGFTLSVASGNVSTLQNRTGTYLIKKDDGRIVDGYNYFIIRHDLPTASYVLNQFEFVADSNLQPISIVTQPFIPAVIGTNLKYISGIAYLTTPLEVQYTVTLANVFSNTFNFDSDALTVVDFSTLVSSFTNSVTGTTTNNGTFSTLSIPIDIVFGSTTSLSTSVYQHISKIDEPVGFNPNSNFTILKSFYLYPNKRRIFDSVGFETTIKRTVQGTFSGATAIASLLSSSWFIDSFTQTSTDLVENFDDEVYRKPNLSTKYGTYNGVFQITSATWNSQLSLITDPAVNNGLQVINSELRYPSFNFGSGSPISSGNPNYAIASTNYSNAFAYNTGFGTSSVSSPTNYRSYTRYINFNTISRSLFTVTINFTNVSFINSDQSLSGNELWLEFKNSTLSSWADATKYYNSSVGINVDGAGCLNAPPTLSTNQISFQVNFGTVASNTYLIRITASPDWSGNITKIVVS